jgi:hypothetical protein
VKHLNLFNFSRRTSRFVDLRWLHARASRLFRALPHTYAPFAKNLFGGVERKLTEIAVTIKDLRANAND